MSQLGSLTLAQFIHLVGSKTPAPGGGAVACSTGATAAAIAKMVVEYSLGKKNLSDHQPALQRSAAALQRLADVFLLLADEDAAAYGLVNELSRLPEQDPRRLAEYSGALEAALQAPRAALAASIDLLRLVSELAPMTNRHLRSDLAIAGVLGEAAARSAWWNVRVNLPGIADAARRSALEADAQREIDQASRLRSAIETACA